MTSPWIAHVKEYMAKHKVSYRTALKQASESYQKKKTHPQRKAKAHSELKEIALKAKHKVSKSGAEKRIRELEIDLGRCKSDKEHLQRQLKHKIDLSDVL